MSTFKELLQASFKSNDTEEWLDVHFTRPIGLVFALFWNKLGVHPNAITILSIFLGAAAGCMFYYTDLPHNILGVALLMLANFCDSTDGQMARLTGKKTLVGRVLDGASGDVWFLFIYFALAFRMMGQYIPGTHLHWGIWIWAMAFFLKGKEGSELDNYAQQRAVYESTPKNKLFARMFYRTYANYCKSQEQRTPKFQQFFKKWKQAQGTIDPQKRDALKTEFLNGSRPLMPMTNALTFNVRAITLYICCLINMPWIYLLVEIIPLNMLYIHMHKRHETLCGRLTEKL